MRAAAGNDELTSIAAGTHPLIPLDYCTTFKPFGGDDYNGGRYNRTISRQNWVQYHIYSIHSFSTGSDFYLVRATLTSIPGHQETNPQRNYTDGSPAYYTHYHAGFTDYLITSAYIEGADNDPAKVALISKVPGDTVPETKTISKGSSWSLGGTFGGGYTQTPGFGANGSLSYSVSHNESISYTTTQWKILNECGVSIPKFRAQFRHEWNDGDNHHEATANHPFADIDRWQDIDVDSETKSRIEYSTSWIWEVKKDFWQDRDSVRIIAGSVIGERFAFGWGQTQRWGGWKGNEHNGKSQTIDVSMPTDLGDLAPAHIYVSRTGFEASSAGSDDVSFELLCNTNWKVESDADWCVMKYDTTGTDTRDRPEKIHFRIEPFKTLTGANTKRRATITVTELLSNNKTGQTAKILVSQLPPDAHIDVRDTDLTAKDEGGTMSFTLKSSGKWTAESDSSWCVIDPSCKSGDATGSGGKAITFKVAQRPEADEIRRATIKVTDDLGNYLNVYVNQGELVFEVSNDNFEIPLGNTATRDFTLTCNTHWTVESDTHDCVIDDSCKSGGNTGANGTKIIFKANQGQGPSETEVETDIITVKAFLPDGSVKTKNINIKITWPKWR